MTNVKILLVVRNNNISLVNLIKNRKFENQKLKYCTKIEIVFKNWNFFKKLKFHKNRNSVQKLKILFKNW